MASWPFSYLLKLSEKKGIFNQPIQTRKHFCIKRALSRYRRAWDSTRPSSFCPFSSSTSPYPLPSPTQSSKSCREIGNPFTTGRFQGTIINSVTAGDSPSRQMTPVPGLVSHRDAWRSSRTTSPAIDIVPIPRP